MFDNSVIVNLTNIQRNEIIGIKKYAILNDINNINSSKKKKFKNSIINDKYLIINFLYHHKNFFTYLFISFSFFIVYLLYYLSLEICTEGVGKCSEKFSWIIKKIKELIYSCILMEMMIQLMIFKIISKKHLIHIIILFIVLFLYSHGFHFHDHGFFNFFFYFIILFIITIIFIPLDCILFYYNNRILKIIIFYIFTLIGLYFFIKFILSNTLANCSDWPKGLNNTYIINNKTLYGCQIKIPNLCLFKIFSHLQDYSNLIRKKCININDGKIQKRKILKQSTSPYLSNKVKRIGYPLINKDPICFLDFSDYNNTLKKFFFQNLVDMDDEESLNRFFKEKKPEVEIDFNNINNPKLILIFIIIKLEVKKENC